MKKWLHKQRKSLELGEAKNQTPMDIRGTSRSRLDSSELEDDNPIEPGEGRYGGENSIRKRLCCIRKDLMKVILKTLLIVLFVALYNVYLVFAIHYHVVNEIDWDWCDGLGFLIIITAFTYGGLLYSYLLKKFVIRLCLRIRMPVRVEAFVYSKKFVILTYLAVLGGIVTFLILDSVNDRYRLVSCGGIVLILGFGLVFSKHRRKIVWRHVMWGMVLQFLFGITILRWDKGRAFFDCLGDKVDKFLGFTDSGSGFVFGYLVHQQPFLTDNLKNNSLAKEIATEINNSKAVQTVVVFKALSTVYFFSFLVSMLYFLGILQWLVMKLGYVLQKTVGTTACESTNAAANIFLGQATAPFLIKPYLSQLTLSEIHAVMTGGFATIAGTVLAAYISFGVSASHLMSASVMSAPAALAFAKLFYPESEKSQTSSGSIKIEPPKEANVLDAAAQGASSAGLLVVNITAIVVAFIAFMALTNSVVGYLGTLVGVNGLTFDIILGKLFIPLTFCMGVEWQDTEKVARLIGVKTILNEFIAYKRLGELRSTGELSDRSLAIATYALCGFANPGSIGVQLATLSSMAPERKADFSRVVFRAFIAGNMACFLTACVAGALYDNQPINES